MGPEMARVRCRGCCQFHACTEPDEETTNKEMYFLGLVENILLINVIYGLFSLQIFSH